MSRGKKKFLIIFFSILSGIGLTFGILMLIVFLVDYYKEKEYQELFDGIQVNNNLIYSSKQDSILYKSKEYTLSKYLGDNNCIEYICEDCIIYSRETNQQYSYFSIDSKGESTLLFNSNDIEVEAAPKIKVGDIFTYYTSKAPNLYQEELRKSTTNMAYISGNFYYIHKETNSDLDEFHG